RLGALPPAVLAQSAAPTVIVQENNALREILSKPNAETSSLGYAEAQPIFNLVETIQRLNERLNEPFVTVNTVTGDMGIKQAQDDYQRLMNNKSPKSKRK
ncbi:MAG: hypothetical protein IJ808_07100, partial [Muribaculaceae bacterium]|nr:hypothetical protein [Muribaculaceae bacterium]